MTEHIKNYKNVLLKRYFFVSLFINFMNYVQTPAQTHPFQIQS